MNIFFSLESSPNEHIQADVPENFFNLTMTFRRDSDIWIPYDTFEEIESDESSEVSDDIWTEEEVEERLKKKDKLALQFVSNCHTHSGREKYLTALMKHANITVFGKCNNKTCTKENCAESELGKNLFRG